MKDQAVKLLNEFLVIIDEYGNYPMCFDTAKQCAIICVDKIYSTLYTDIEKQYWENIKAQLLIIKYDDLWKN